MEDNHNVELPSVMDNNELDIVKNELGLEAVLNQLLPSELLENGYRKMEINEATYLEPLFELAPQLLTEKAKNATIQRSFEEVTKNSYKCILDPSKHLATIKGTTDVYIGGALDNKTNQVAGQARWLKNDAQLTVSNAPDIALNAFNALSVVTGQYFMSQVNSNLLEINSGIQGIQKYLEEKEESELKTAIQELDYILNHLQFIKKSPERIQNTIAQIDGIRKTSRDAINLNKKLIDNVMKQENVSDKEAVINENLNKIRKNLIQYRFAVYIYNRAHILKVYLNNITDTEELQLYYDELATIAQEYKDSFHNAIKCTDNYLNETNALNKAGKMQIVFSLGSGIAATLLGGRNGNYKLGNQAASIVNDLFDDNRKKKKNEFVLTQEEYNEHMSDMMMVESSVKAMEKYIDISHKPVEIISCEGDYYIKYL